MNFQLYNLVMQPTDEIKSKLDIVEVLREYIQLKAAGTSFRALCPFHNEKSPSFIVSPEKQIWHCFGCFPKGALIKRENDLVPIETLKRGDCVISGKGNRKKVLLTMKRDYEGKLISVQTRKTNEMVAMTADHEVYVIKTKHCKQKSRLTRLCQSRCTQNCPDKYFKKYKIEKMRAEYLEKDDYLLYPVNNRIEDVKTIDLRKFLDRKLTNYGPQIKSIPPKIKVDENFLKLLGYYIAEGSGHRAYIRFSLGGHEFDFAKEIQLLIKKVFRLESGLHVRRNGKSGIEISCCNSNLANIFENLCGKGASNKHIPYEFNYLPVKKQKIILEAIFKGDGSTAKGSIKSRAGERQITTISRFLSHQLKDMLLRIGFQPGITFEKSKKDKKGVNHKDAFTVRWREDLKGNYTDFIAEKNVRYWLLPIRKIIRNNFKGEVYNITVQGDHSYIANHFSVGNCGKGGDIFSFVMEMEGVGFKEALRTLANKAGVKLERQDPRLVSQHNRLLDIIELSGKYFHKMLLDSKEAEKAREYLKERGLSDDTIDEWNIGYAPESWDHLLNFLKSKNYNDNEIFLAGMSVKREKMSGYYNRFRGRIMFPIRDINCNTVAFTARVMPGKEDSEKQGKYINSPQSAAYDKSRILFGLDKGKTEIKKKDLSILVEGQMDVITAHQKGYRNVIASSGTALTQDQVNLLKRYSNNIALAFDMDKAGEMAAERGIKVAMNMEMNIKVVKVPNGKDPDECIKNNPEEWEKAVAEAKPMMQYYFDRVFSGLNPNDVADKRLAAKKLLPVIGDLGSNIEQDHWLKKLSEIIDVKEYMLRDTLSKAMAVKKNQGRMEKSMPVTASKNEPESREEKLSQVAMALLLKFPELSELAANRLELDFLVGDESRAFYKNYIIYYNNTVEGNSRFLENEGEKAVNYANFRKWLEISAVIDERQGLEIMLKFADKLGLLSERDFFDYDIEKAKVEIINILMVLKSNYLKLRMKEIEKMIRKAEDGNDKGAFNDLLKEFKFLTDELNNISI